jgi:hypothetical protein
MNFKSLAICVALLGIASAQAQYAQVAGTFKSASTTVDLIALDPELGVIAAQATVAIGACSGSVAGVGKISGNRLTFSPYVKVESIDSCVITVVFDKSNNSAQVSEHGCSNYHGSSCGWEGSMVKRAK